MTAAVPAPALVPAVVRAPVRWVVGAAALTFAVLAVRFAGTSEAGGVDRRVDAVVDPFGDAHHRLISRLTMLGSPPSVVALAFCLAAVCLALGRYRLAVLAIAGPGVTGVCTTLLKPALGRTIGDSGYAFPSGHTGGATSLGLVAALLVLSLLRPGRGGWLAILAAGGLVVGGGVGVGMVATNAHYPTDTIGGFCTAVVVVLTGALLVDRLAMTRARRRAASDAAPDDAGPRS